ncbi:hypothetical protein MA16_Dca021488 [Dendrobium catenatum]|uniref:Uncharacterized protein n=1 Tax=Dendrobium catenatum TaxID=906689 RepID=A0A2I0WZ80_9ASPA|nr:hypothetical protein MA16_Dca021488 [Dendrobium catenatum]
MGGSHHFSFTSFSRVHASKAPNCTLHGQRRPGSCTSSGCRMGGYKHGGVRSTTAFTNIGGDGSLQTGTGLGFVDSSSRSESRGIAAAATLESVLKSVVMEAILDAGKSLLWFLCEPIPENKDDGESVDEEDEDEVEAGDQEDDGGEEDYSGYEGDEEERNLRPLAVEEVKMRMGMGMMKMKMRLGMMKIRMLRKKKMIIIFKLNTTVK